MWRNKNFIFLVIDTAKITNKSIMSIEFIFPDVICLYRQKKSNIAQFLGTSAECIFLFFFQMS